MNFRGYFGKSAKNWAQDVGRSFTLSVLYMNPVVPQSFGTDHVPSGSCGRPRNFGSMTFRTPESRFQSIFWSRPCPASVATMYPLGVARSYPRAPVCNLANNASFEAKYDFLTVIPVALAKAT